VTTARALISASTAITARQRILRLPEPYRDTLLDGVIAQARAEFAQL